MTADGDLSVGVGAAALRVGGFLPFTMVDYPGALAAVIFCQGCPLRCLYCHNRGLTPACGTAQIEWKDIRTHLERRAGLLDAVVFSGGEPLMQAALCGAMKQAKTLGYKIGLHTSGVAPGRLRQVVPLLDWVGFDVKAPFEKYQEITGVHGAGEKARQSLAMLTAANIQTEVRTTLWPGHVDCDEVSDISRQILEMGVEDFAVQEARDPVTRAPKKSAFFTDLALQNEIAEKFENYVLRRAA